MLERRRFEELARYARALHECGFAANHDGNASLRDDDGRFIATPTALSKRLIHAADLLVVDRAGKVLRGRHRLFSEWSLHRAVYDARPDARAVVHAHPPIACGFAIAGLELEANASAEIVVSLGDRIPTVPFSPPGSPTLEVDVARAAESCDVLLLAQHGVLTLGDDLEQAFLRLELVEHYAHQLLIARQLGGPLSLAAEQVERLLDARARAGLGPEARGLPRATTRR